jgi:hypothetical protein
MSCVLSRKLIKSIYKSHLNFNLDTCKNLGKRIDYLGKTHSLIELFDVKNAFIIGQTKKAMYRVVFVNKNITNIRKIKKIKDIILSKNNKILIENDYYVKNIYKKSTYIF